MIGIISEGPSDHAVIGNVLKGTLKIDLNTQVQYLSPELYADETELNKGELNILSFGGWTSVKRQCIEKEVINRFFEEYSLVSDNLALVIQIDTAERNLINYEVIDPQKTKNQNYSENLRKNIIIKINEWLNHPYENLFYAIAIEETEAWLLALYEKKKNDTSEYNKPKEECLEKVLPRVLKSKEKKVLSYKDEFIKYGNLSRKLRKPKELTKARTKNKSLDLFCLSLEEGFNDESQEEE